MPRRSLTILIASAIIAGFIPVASMGLPRAYGVVKTPIDDLVAAIRADDSEKVARMLDEDPSLATTETRAEGATPLHYAGSVKVAQLLLDQGANLFALDRQYHATPLRWLAVRFHRNHPRNLELVHYLQSKGASEPDFFFAVAIGDVDRVKDMVAKDKLLAVTPGDADDVLADGAKPIHLAASNGQLEVLKVLVDNGANVNDRGSWHNTEAMEKACWGGWADVTEYLLDHGAKVDGPPSTYSDSPIFNAAVAAHADVVKILLDHGAKVRPELLNQVKASMKDAAADPAAAAEYKRIIEMLSPK